jgi:hypothetical protein
MTTGSDTQIVRRRGALPAAGALVILSALAGVALAVVRLVAPAGADTVHPIVDTRLVLAPRTVAIQAALPRGLQLRGTLFPALPGPNRVRLVASHGAGARIGTGQMHLVVTMPGMPMRPIAATLSAHGDSYNGTLHLPMFGLYRAAVALSSARSRYTGALTFVVPLPVSTAHG